MVIHPPPVGTRNRHKDFSGSDFGYNYCDEEYSGKDVLTPAAGTGGMTNKGNDYCGDSNDSSQVMFIWRIVSVCASFERSESRQKYCPTECKIRFFPIVPSG
jgi:hypothetical protein